MSVNLSDRDQEVRKISYKAITDGLINGVPFTKNDVISIDYLYDVENPTTYTYSRIYNDSTNTVIWDGNSTTPLPTINLLEFVEKHGYSIVDACYGYDSEILASYTNLYEFPVVLGGGTIPTLWNIIDNTGGTIIPAGSININLPYSNVAGINALLVGYPFIYDYVAGHAVLGYNAPVITGALEIEYGDENGATQHSSISNNFVQMDENMKGVLSHIDDCQFKELKSLITDVTTTCAGGAAGTTNRTMQITPVFPSGGTIPSFHHIYDSNTATLYPVSGTPPLPFTDVAGINAILTSNSLPLVYDYIGGIPYFAWNNPPVDETLVPVPYMIWHGDEITGSYTKDDIVANSTVTLGSEKALHVKVCESVMSPQGFTYVVAGTVPFSSIFPASHIDKISSVAITAVGASYDLVTDAIFAATPLKLRQNSTYIWNQGTGLLVDFANVTITGSGEIDIVYEIRK